jgi:hypothetical protein
MFFGVLDKHGYEQYNSEKSDYTEKLYKSEGGNGQ